MVRRFFLFFVMWVLLIGAAVPDTVLSQMQEDTDVYRLGEVVVKAGKNIIESTGTVREITAEEIHNQGARTLDEALKLVPGINIRAGADGIPRVDLRGFRSRHVLLLLDGIPFNSTFDGQFDPSLIPVENIAEIKVSYGTHSVLYGDGGLGGVINIITKQGKEGIRGMLSGEAGETAHYLGRLDLSGGHDKGNFLLTGSSFTQNGYALSSHFTPTPSDKGGVRDNSDKERNNLFANVNYSPTDDLHLGAFFNYSRGEFGIPPSTINNLTDPFANKQTYVRVDNSEGYAGHLSLSYDLPGPFGIRSWFFFNTLSQETKTFDNNRYNSMVDPTVNGTGDLKNKTTITGASLQPTCNLKSLGVFTLGLNARKEEFNSEGQIRDVLVSSTGGGTGAGKGKGGGKSSANQYAFENISTDRHLDFYSAAIQYEVSPFRNAGLSLGYAQNWFERDDGGSDNAGSYMAGIYYDLFENTRVKSSFARKIRFPDIRELFDATSGDPNLTTEKSYNYELGIEQRLDGNSKVTLTGFREDVRNYIEKDDATNKFENNSNYRFQGLELTAETRFRKNILLGVGYTYLHTKDKSPGTQKDELQNEPKHKFTFESKYTFDSGFSAYMNVAYLADQVTYSGTTPLLKKKLNDFALVNVKFDQSLLKGRVTIYAGVNNLFDKNYEESYGFPQPGRFIYAGTEIRF